MDLRELPTNIETFAKYKIQPAHNEIILLFQELFNYDFQTLNPDITHRNKLIDKFKDLIKTANVDLTPQYSKEVLYALIYRMKILIPREFEQNDLFTLLLLNPHKKVFEPKKKYYIEYKQIHTTLSIYIYVLRCLELLCFTSDSVENLQLFIPTLRQLKINNNTALIAASIINHSNDSLVDNTILLIYFQYIASQGIDKISLNILNKYGKLKIF